MKREGGREGRGKESKNETRGMSSLFFFFSFFFSLKIRRKNFPKYTEGGELECSDLVFEGNEITVVGQREQPGGKLDRFVAGECKFLHLISCIFFPFLFFSSRVPFPFKLLFFFFNRHFFHKSQNSSDFFPSLLNYLLRSLFESLLLNNYRIIYFVGRSETWKNSFRCVKLKKKKGKKKR